MIPSRYQLFIRSLDPYRFPDQVGQYCLLEEEGGQAVAVVTAITDRPADRWIGRRIRFLKILVQYPYHPYYPGDEIDIGAVRNPGWYGGWRLFVVDGRTGELPGSLRITVCNNCRTAMCHQSEMVCARRADPSKIPVMRLRDALGRERAAWERDQAVIDWRIGWSEGEGADLMTERALLRADMECASEQVELLRRMLRANDIEGRYVVDVKNKPDRNGEIPVDVPAGWRLDMVEELLKRVAHTRKLNAKAVFNQRTLFCRPGETAQFAL